MSELSVPGRRLSPEELYTLLDKQVRSYHKQRRMGENTSVPVELARELLESLEYTLEQGAGSLEEGQRLLEERHTKAKGLLRLIMATAPNWQTECRWETLGSLGRYLEGYDFRHLAHRVPEDLYYPILSPVPDGLRGIDRCLHVLRLLWLENQIMAGAETLDVEALWDRLHRDVLNQCEQLLINGTGKALLHEEPAGLTFSQEERSAIAYLVCRMPREELWMALENASKRLCRWLALTDGDAAAHARAILPSLKLRLEGSSIDGLFR